MPHQYEIEMLIFVLFIQTKNDQRDLSLSNLMTELTSNTVRDSNDHPADPLTGKRPPTGLAASESHDRGCIADLA
jgi:hypothetical protein